jgi:hypothetical protein
LPIGKYAATCWTISSFGRLRLGFLAAIVVCNSTEAAFQGLSFLFFVFWVIAIDYPRYYLTPVEECSEAGSAEEMELIYLPDSNSESVIS